MPIKFFLASSIALSLTSCTTVKPRVSVETISKCWVTCKGGKTLDYIEQNIEITGLGYSVSQGSIRCVCKDRTVVDVVPNNADAPSNTNVR